MTIFFNILAAVVVFCNSNIAFARVHFIPSPNHSECCIEYLEGKINSAQNSVNILVRFTDNEIISSAMANAVSRGVSVSLITSVDSGNDHVVNSVEESGVDVVRVRMANDYSRFAVFDHKDVVLLNTDFDHGKQGASLGHCLDVDHEDLVTTYHERFANIWLAYTGK